MISMMLSEHSWVARWNEINGVQNKPGIYAANLIGYEEEDNYYEKEKNPEDDE